MATELFAFTERERATYLDTLAYVKKLRQLGLNVTEDIRCTMAPEVYIAQIPDAGIPPLDVNVVGSGSGSGTGPTLDIPGSSHCQIFNLVYNLSTADYELTAVPDLDDVLVFNITPSYIFKGYAIVAREKFGSWLLTSPWRTRWPAKTAQAIASKSSGPCNIYLDRNVITDPLWQVTAWLKWMNGTSSIGSGAEVMVEWIQNARNTNGSLGQWWITEREC